MAQRPYHDRLNENTQSLLLASCNVGDTGVDKLLSCDWNFLKKLDLSNQCLNEGHNKLTDVSLQKLGAQNWDNLISLHLGKNEITDKGVEALMKAKFPNLKSLRINNCPGIGDETVLKIAQSKLPSLEILWLSFCKITPKGVENFTKGDFSKIKSLHINGNHFGAEGAEALVKTKWPNLQKFHIYDCNLKDAGVLAISQAQWPHLKDLHLSNNGITDQGVKFLLQSKWPSVQIIHLSTNPIGESGAEQILAQDWPNIKLIKMRRLKPIGEEIKKKIRGKFYPKAELHLDP